MATPADIYKLNKDAEEKTACRCPVCNGNGLVQNGFYSQTSGCWTSGSTEFEQCRSCGGTGVVWSN